MGRKTWESIGRALPQRQAIVISRQPGFSAADAEVASSLQQALAQARLPSPVYCIGGGEIFAIALPHATRMHVTEIAAAFPGDAFFPDFDRSGWRETFRETHAPGGEASFGYAFVTYDRVRAEAGTA